MAHAAASGVVSALVWTYFRSVECALVSFASGVFIDIDHLVDYYLNNKFTFNLKKIYAFCAETRMKKIYFPLHSYELVIGLWVCVFVFSLPGIWIAAVIGITQHLIFDQITNPINTYGYFLTFRAAKGFDKDRIINFNKGVVSWLH